MLERLDVIRLQPQSWAHWEPLRGGMQAHQQLLQRYPQASAWLVTAQAEEARAVQAQPLKAVDQPELGAVERLIIQYAAQMTVQVRVDDSVFARMQQQFTTTELVEITAQTEEEAKALILKAREHWFAGQA